MIYPLDRNSAWISSNGLHHRPDEKDEDEVVDDEESDGGRVAPGMNIKEKEFDDAKVEEDYDDDYDD